MQITFTHLSPCCARQQQQQHRAWHIRTAAAYGNYEEADRPVVITPALGNRVEKWLKTPLDILSFGPRAVLGALVSLPQRAQSLQADLDRVNLILQDPRPLEDKRDELAQEVETVLVDCVERGAGVEADTLATVVALLPEDLKSVLPEELQAALGRSGAPAASAPTPTAAPLVEYTPMPAATLETNQIAAEMADLRDAVRLLRGAVDSLAANAERAQDKVLRLNVREARGSLALRVQQLSPATTASPDASITAAVREAQGLLAEVDALEL